MTNNFSHIFKKHKHIVSAFLLFFFTGNIVCATASEVTNANKEQTVNSYTQLAKYHLPSLAQQDLAEQENAKNILAENSKIKIDQQNIKNLGLVKMPPLGDIESLKLFYNVFASQQAGDSVQPSLADNIAYDLEVYCGSKETPEQHLFASLDNTQTVVGKIQLQKILYQPTTNIEILQQRQAIVQTLLADESLFQALDKKLETIKNVEKDFIWFWKELDTTTDSYFNQVYFKTGCLKNLNTKPGVMGVNAVGNLIGKPTLLFLQSNILGAFLQAIYLKPMMLKAIDIKDNTGFIKSFGQSILDGVNPYNYYQTISKWGLSKGATAFLVTMWFVGKGILAYQIVDTVKTCKLNNSIMTKIQNKMINVGTFVNALNGIQNLVKDYPVLDNDALITTNLGSSKDINVASFAKLFNLNTNTESATCSKGKALAAYKQLPLIKNKFIASLETLGKLDAYLSIAKLYKKTENNPTARFCFADYVQQDKPYVNINNFWHPILDPENVVTNNFELGTCNGQTQAQNVVLTGPNKGGKSTALKATIIAVILAQTLGIVPAQSMTITPFTLINSYLNIADSIGKESLFQAEIHRAQDLLNAIKALSPTEFSFVIMDEIFTGTNPREGMAAAYGVAKKLATYTNNMAVIATHYKILTDLQKDTNGAIENLKVSVDRGPKGKIIPTYKLEKGISNQEIAIDLLEQGGFDAEILQDAQRVLDRKIQAA